MFVVSALALLAWAAAPAAAKLDAAQVVEAIAAKAARPVNLVLAAESKIGLVDAHPVAPLLPVKLSDWKKFTTNMKCGAGLGVCPPGFCCGPDGLCGQTPDACSSVCQLHYSGPGSACTANLPQPLVTTDALGKTVGSLPPVPSGGVCGVYIGACAAPGECCSQFGVCTASPYFCSIPSCVREASPHSPPCQAVWDRVKPVQRKYRLVATWGTADPDGNERPVILVNGKFPGPTITGAVGDRLIIEFINLLDEPSSIHWHGIRQIATSLSDGVPPVVQREVGPATGPGSAKAGDGNATAPMFVYDFVLDAPGTFWYHSHVSVQYMDGMRGTLVVTDPYALAPYGDGSITHSPVFFTHDWNWNTTAQLLPLVNAGNNAAAAGPQSVLVNGWGQSAKCMQAGTCRVPVIRGAAGTCDDPKTRVRFIGASGNTPVTVTFYATDASRLETYLTGMDGVRVNPTNNTGETAYLAAGQRLTIQPCTATGSGPASAEPVWIKAVTTLGNGKPTWITWALLDLDGRYEEAAFESGSIPWADAPPLPAGATAVMGKKSGPVDDVPAQPIVSPLGVFIPPKPTKTLYFDIGTFKPDPPAASQYTVNNVSLQPDEAGPSLLEQIYKDGYEPATPGGPYPSNVGWNVVDNKLGEVVELVILNTGKGGGAVHPFHTHGHWMLVTSLNGFNTAGFTPAPSDADPVLLARDTIAVAPGSNMSAIYVVDNPSAWIVHCHIEWHIVKGLGWVFRDGI